MFDVQPLNPDSKKAMLEKNIWNPDGPISLERLNKVTFSHYIFEDDVVRQGELVVMDVVAPSVLKIMNILFQKRFPIYSAKPIEHYNGDDQLSMADNNSSGFNCRRVLGSQHFSLHAYGLAIDINPIQNPFLDLVKLDQYSEGTIQVSPAAGISYLNRHNQRPGMLEAIVDIFKQYGFPIWGGHWNEPIDYHHFQTTRDMAERLAVLPYEEGCEYFKASI